MNTKPIIIVLVLVVGLIVVLGVSYMLLQPQQSYIYQSQPNPPNATSSEDSTTSISSDLDQVPGDASVEVEMNNLDKNIQGF